MSTIAVSGCVAYYFIFQQESLLPAVEYNVAIILTLLLMAVTFPAYNVYNSWRGRSIPKLFVQIMFGWSTVVVLLMLMGVLLGVTEEYSRSWLGVWFLVGYFCLISVRIVTWWFLKSIRRSGWNNKDILIIGAGSLGGKIAKNLQASAEHGFHVKYFLDDDESLWGSAVEGVQVKPIEEVEEIIANNQIYEVWVVLPLRAEERVKEIVHRLRQTAVSVRYVPDIFTYHLFNHAVVNIAGYQVISITSSPMTGLNLAVKVVEDYVLAVVILLLISPALLSIAVAVKLTSKGPILFKQKRHGWGGRTINVYKFRSMEVHADKNGVTQATKGDPRLTKIGGFLRKSSLDELPQFFNVLQGRMSIVGPRPHAVEHNDFYKDKIDAYMMRHKVKPGITGWAQVNGLRGETDTLDKMEKRVEYDLYYIEHWSLLFDLKIIMMTIFKGFLNENAY